MDAVETLSASSTKNLGKNLSIDKVSR